MPVCPARPSTMYSTAKRKLFGIAYGETEKESQPPPSGLPCEPLREDTKSYIWRVACRLNPVPSKPWTWKKQFSFRLLFPECKPSEPSFRRSEDKNGWSCWLFCWPKNTKIVKKLEKHRISKWNAVFLVEISGIEPLTSWMPFKRSPSWAIPPYSVAVRQLLYYSTYDRKVNTFFWFFYFFDPHRF